MPNSKSSDFKCALSRAPAKGVVRISGYKGREPYTYKRSMNTMDEIY